MQLQLPFCDENLVFNRRMNEIYSINRKYKPKLTDLKVGDKVKYKYKEEEFR